MNKTFLKRSVASVLSILMAFSTAVPNSFVSAEDTGIESEIAQEYVATISQTENGTVSFVSEGNETQSPVTYIQGTSIEVTTHPADGFNTAKVEIKDADKTVVASLDNGKVTAKGEDAYIFEMPDSNISVDVVFEETVTTEETTTETETTESETETTTEVKTEETTEVSTEETELTTETTEVTTETTEGVVEEVKPQIYEEFNKDSLVSKDVVNQYDFSSREIILATENADIIVDKDDIVDNGNGMYVLRYATVEHAKNAYSYYYGKVDFIAPNIVVTAAEGKTEYLF